MDESVIESLGLTSSELMSIAWYEVTATTIHYFCHTGLCSSQAIETDQFDSEDNPPLGEWIK